MDRQPNRVVVVGVGVVVFLTRYSPSPHFLQFNSVPRCCVRPCGVSTHSLVVIGG